MTNFTSLTFLTTAKLLDKAEMLDFLGLHKDQNTVFIILYQKLSTGVPWS